jgi:hypothetical protein
MAAETLAFLEAISLEPAELRFCEGFDDRSRSRNFREHSHPCFEMILSSEAGATVVAGGDSLDASPVEVVIRPPGLSHTDRQDPAWPRGGICL